MKTPVKRLLVTLALLAGIQHAGAQALIPLYSFTGGNDGGDPQAPLVQASDGNLYGTTYEGTNNEGAVFRITTNGVFTLLDSFTGGNGSFPNAGLVQANDGNLYGTTQAGGAYGTGTVFRIATNGVLTVIHSFLLAQEGYNPFAGLIQASDGNLYGIASFGATNENGTVFRITTNGSLTVIHYFTGGQDGGQPIGGLVQASDGNLYGTTQVGGAHGIGVVFRINTSGVLTPLYSFTGGNDGGVPSAGLMQANDGNLYGTAEYGGAYGNGTIFRITTNGAFTSLYSFTGGNDGGSPVYTSLLQVNDGYLYGTTSEGGTSNDGVVFRITTSGALTPVYSFTGANGNGPQAGLVQASDGNLYGTAEAGGTNGYGTVFKVILPPPPLNILPDGNQSCLYWLGSNADYVLQSTTSLASTNWVTISNVVPAIAITITVPHSSSAQFFRLVNP